MTQEEQTVLMIKGVVSGLSPEQKKQFDQVYVSIQNVIKENGDIGTLALALIGAEAAV